VVELVDAYMKILQTRLASPHVELLVENAVDLSEATLQCRVVVFSMMQWMQRALSVTTGQRFLSS
jgi:hypothetical protein